MSNIASHELQPIEAYVETFNNLIVPKAPFYIKYCPFNLSKAGAEGYKIALAKGPEQRRFSYVSTETGDWLSYLSQRSVNDQREIQSIRFEPSQPGTIQLDAIPPESVILEALDYSRELLAIYRSITPRWILVPQGTEQPQT